MSDDRKEYKHPSYGMISFNRSSNGTSRRLFGSPLESHYSTVRIAIGSGVRIHEHHADRYHGSLRGEYIEVEMSAAQFAEVLVTMNQGSGIPCTIRYIEGRRIEDPPAVETEAKKIKNGFDESLKGYTREAKKYADEITQLCETLPAKKRERIRIALGCMTQQMSANVPFVLRQFEEASTRVVTAAKHEINAFATQTLGDARPQLPPLVDDSKALPEPARPAKHREPVQPAFTLDVVKDRIARSENKTQAFIAEQLASAIDGYLKHFVATQTSQDNPDEGRGAFYLASAYARQNRVVITYISYQGETPITIEEAERYLEWLGAGNVGRHFEALRDG